VAAGILVILLALAAAFAVWWRIGRDEASGLPAGVEWKPPEGLSPAEVGTLVDRRLDPEGVTALVADLAVRGFLSIETETMEAFSALSSRDYIFRRADRLPAGEALAPHEDYVYGRVFSTGRVVHLADLRAHFHDDLPAIRAMVSEEMVRKGLFRADPRPLRQGAMAAAVVLVGGAVAVMLACPLALWPVWAGLFTGAAIAGLAGNIRPGRTAAGSAALRRALAFQRFLRLAERRRIEALAAEDTAAFGRLLPYAMALGVANYWTNAFQVLMRDPAREREGYYGLFGGGALPLLAMLTDLGVANRAVSHDFGPRDAGLPRP
jgi:hypothetical protein